VRRGQVVDALLGGAIDDLLAARLQLLASSTTVAALVRRLHQLLWPAGVWFLKVPQQVPEVCEDGPVLPCAYVRTTDRMHMR
jgi:hypothetical protein